MEFVQHVKSAADIVAVIGERIRLRKQGPDRYLGLCPFHQEKTPSFSVHARHQFYKCFGCGKGGDVFTFLMEIEGLTFFEALQQLAEQYGIPVPKRGAGEGADPETKRREALYRIHELTQKFYRESLLSRAGSAPRAYLERRGVDAALCERFGVGFAPASGNKLLAVLRREGFSEADMEASGLVLRSERDHSLFDRFRGRLMFPIQSESGKIIAFAGRALGDEQPKYLNSPETAIYKKHAILYNLHRAKAGMRRHGRAVLVEGYMDVIGAARSGVEELVATCGTALTPQQVRLMRRHADTVVVNFDGDDAGRNATERSIQVMLEEAVHVRVLELPDGVDPDEYCGLHGAEAYRELLGAAPSYHIWLAGHLQRQFDVKTTEGRVAALERLLPAIQKAPSKLARVSMADELADHLGIERGLLLERFRRMARDRRGEIPVAQEAASRFTPSEKILIRLFAASEEARAELLPEALQSAREHGLSSAGIFTAFSACSQSGAFHYSELEARLEEDRRAEVARIVLQEEECALTLEDGRAALRALNRQRLEVRDRELNRLIAEAEKSGDKAALMDLMKQKIALQQQRAGGAASEENTAGGGSY